MIELNNVWKSYGDNENQTHVLKNLNISIQDGECVAIMGPSGAGKTSLLHILGLLDLPSSGEYFLNRSEVTNKRSKEQLARLRNEHIGFVFQNFALLEEYTALENVMMPLQYRHTKKSLWVEKAKNALRIVGLESHTHKRPNQLSGGQQQRVAIARAIVGEPSVLLADEPTGALDQDTGRHIIDVLKQINASGRTVIIVTHDPQIGDDCERIIHMKDGQIATR